MAYSHPGIFREQVYLTLRVNRGWYPKGQETGPSPHQHQVFVVRGVWWGEPRGGPGAMVVARAVAAVLPWRSVSGGFGTIWRRENGPPGDPGHSSGASPVNPPFCWRSADVVEQSPGVLVPSASILEDGIWSTVNFRIKSGLIVWSAPPPEGKIYNISRI